MTKATWSRKGRQPIEVPWGVADALHGIGLVAVGGLITVVVLGQFRSTAGPAEGDAVTTLAIALLTSLLLASVWLFAINRYSAPWRSLGLDRPTLGWALVLPFLCLILSIVFLGVYVALVTEFGPEALLPDRIEADDLGSGGFRVVNFVTVGVVGPFAEEVFFRGFLLTAFVPSLGVFRAAALASAVFAIGHVDLSVMVPFFFTGLLLSWLYLRTRSIWPPFIAHAAQNLLAIIGMLASG